MDYAKIKAIADDVGAIAMMDMAHIAGLIAAGLLKNPFDYGFHIVTTTTHKTLRGPRGGMILSRGKVSNPLKAVEKTVENLPTLIDRSIFPGFQGGPHMNNIAALAGARRCAQPVLVCTAASEVADFQGVAIQPWARFLDGWQKRIASASRRG